MPILSVAKSRENQSPSKLGDYIIYLAKTKGLQVSLDVDALNNIKVTSVPQNIQVDSLFHYLLKDSPYCVEKMSDVYVFYPCPKAKKVKKEEAPISKITKIERTILSDPIDLALKESTFNVLNRMNTLGFETKEGEWLWNSSNVFIKVVEDSVEIKYRDGLGYSHTKKLVSDTVSKMEWVYLIDKNKQASLKKPRKRYLNGVVEHPDNERSRNPWHAPLQKSLSSSDLFDAESVERGHGPNVIHRLDKLNDRSDWIMHTNSKGFQVGNIDSWIEWCDRKDSIDQYYLTASLNRIAPFNGEISRSDDALYIPVNDQYLASLSARYEHMVGNDMFYTSVSGAMKGVSARHDEPSVERLTFEKRRMYLDFLVGFQFYFNKNRSLDVALREKYLRDWFFISKNSFLPEYQSKNSLSSTDLSIVANYPVRKRHMFSWGVNAEILMSHRSIQFDGGNFNPMLVYNLSLKDQFRISPKVLLRGEVGFKYFNRINRSGFHYNLFLETMLKENASFSFRTYKQIKSSFTARMYYPSTGLFETSTIYQETMPIQSTYNTSVFLRNVAFGWSELDVELGWNYNDHVVYLSNSLFYTDESIPYLSTTIHKELGSFRFATDYTIRSYETKNRKRDLVYLDGVSHAFGGSVVYEDNRWRFLCRGNVNLGDPWVLPFKTKVDYANYWTKLDFDIHYKCNILGYRSLVKLYGTKEGAGSNIKASDVLLSVGDRQQDVGLVEPSWYLGVAVELRF
ncbi:MAG: hypothetical protein ACPGSG_08790 [Prolixibacteraceae bacterium]